MYSFFRGEVVQKGSSDELLFDDREVIEYLSSFMTIEPGSIISMGSIGYLETRWIIAGTRYQKARVLWKLGLRGRGSGEPGCG